MPHLLAIFENSCTLTFFLLHIKKLVKEAQFNEHSFDLYLFLVEHCEDVLF